jgi:hypothetical protein
MGMSMLLCQSDLQRGDSMAWYEGLVAKDRYICEAADHLAWEDAKISFPLEDRYEFEEGNIYVSGWSSVDCAGDIIPIPDPSSRSHRIVLSGDLVEKMAIDAGFKRGDWFWKNVLENWQDFDTEFYIRIRGCEPVLEIDEYVRSDFEKWSSDIDYWIERIKGLYFYGNEDKFDKWVSKDSNRERLVDFLCSFDEWFHELGGRLIEHIKGFVEVYNDQLEYYISAFAARKVAEDLADEYQRKFVKVCSEFYKRGETIPGAVFVLVRDEVWEEFLKSELAAEIAEDEYDALDKIRASYMDILTEFLGYPDDLVDVAGSLFVSDVVSRLSE